MSSVEVVGLAEAKAKLGELLPNQMRATERSALRAGGALLRKRIQARAPVRTGHLKAKGVFVSTRASGSEASVSVGVDYVGRFNELGTVHMAARPFMRPALDESQEDIVNAYGEQFKARIEKLTTNG